VRIFNLRWIIFEQSSPPSVENPSSGACPLRLARLSSSLTSKLEKDFTQGDKEGF
jgi:hypothetical protein